MAGKGRQAAGAAAGSPPSGNKVTPSAASRIQSTQAKGGNDTGKGSFPSRVQSAAARNTNAGGAAGAGAGGKTSGAKGGKA
ncbi:hypothetical protein NEOLEDRAFT_1238177 [Neolentinus lepideus HHB14362 ss-1]|uniref:SMP domain-containing protein n=1 Tax=Neolentinus lepideus HHB14362 ss-1 TaxID=1314782 RepID=A0A165VQ80_9AGAM|nr:hypothetical protein NEOLEDRAFT_1238177 [Neolentinus lepideus HHB14362 ss-1]